MRVLLSSFGRLHRVFRLELEIQLRQPLLWIWLGTMTVHVAALWWSQAYTLEVRPGSTLPITSGFYQARLLLMMAPVFYLFFVAVPAGTTLLQDEEHKVGAILHATPLRPWEYIWGKFGAVLTCAIGAGLVHTMIKGLGALLLPAERAEVLAPSIDLRSFLEPVVVFLVPLIVSVAGVSFALGERLCRGAWAMLWPLAIFLGGLSQLWLPAPRGMDPTWNRLLMWIDPVGYRWFYETWIYEDRGSEFYRTHTLSFDAPFLWSRVALVLLGLAAVAWSERHFARTVRGAARVRTEFGSADRINPLPRSDVPVAPMRVRPPGVLRTVATVTAAELEALAGQTGVVVFIPVLLAFLVWSATTGHDANGVSIRVTSGSLAGNSFDLLSAALCLLLLFTGVESLERERACGLEPIHRTLPYPTGAPFAGKYMANILLALLIVVLALAASAVLLIQLDTAPLEALPFLVLWGLLLPPTLLCWSAFVLAAGAISGSRYAAYGAGLAALGATAWCVINGHVSWLGNWGLFDAVSWTDLGAFEIDGPALLLNRLLVLCAALALLAAAIRYQRRREPDATRRAARRTCRAVLREVLWLVMVSAPALSLAELLSLEVRDASDGEQAMADARAYRQRNRAAWIDAPVPAVVAVDLDVELEPGRHWFRTRGGLELINHRSVALTEVPLSGASGWEEVRWTLEGRPASPEHRAGLYVFHLNRPLEPGMHVTVGFEVSGTVPGGMSVGGGAPLEFILPSSILLTSFQPTIAPVVGYVEALGLPGMTPVERETLALEMNRRPGDPRAILGSDLPFTTAIRVSAPEEYTLNAVGTKVSESVSGGRRSVLWKSDVPVYQFNLVAGRWAVRRGTRTALYYHPGHAYNVEAMGRTLEDALRCYSEWFRPYPWDELKLSEFRGGQPFAQSMATNIDFSEQLGFLSDTGEGADGAALIVAHEVAHQWWGNIVMPGRTRGSTVLAEGMANYAAMLLFEAVEGDAGRIAVARRLEDQYLKGHKRDLERPLAETGWAGEGEGAVVYDKGAFALWQLHTVLGREAMLQGLQAFIRRFEGRPDHPALQDLLDALRPLAPDPAVFDERVTGWFHEVHLPRYRLSGLRLEPVTGAAEAQGERVSGSRVGPGAAGGGSREEWRVRVVVENRGSGCLPVEVAAARGERFVPGARGAPSSPSPAYREVRSEVRPCEGKPLEVVLRCPFRPERVVVDPDVRVLQSERRSAEVKLEP